MQHKKACKSGAEPRLQAFYESLIRITSMNFSRILFMNFFMNSYNIFFLCILLINSLLHRRSISPEYGMPSSEAVYSPSGNSHGLSVPGWPGLQITQSDGKSISVQDNRRACDNISRYSADIVWHAGKKLTVIAVNPNHSLRCSIG